MKEVSLVKGCKPKTVGAYHNNYVIVGEDNRVYSSEAYENEVDVKYYGKVGLFELDNTHFGSS